MKFGLYEQVINEEINKMVLDNNEVIIDKEKIDEDNSAKTLAKYLEEIIEKKLIDIMENTSKDKEVKIKDQVSFVNNIIEGIKDSTKDDTVMDLIVDEKAEQLLSIIESKNNVSAINKKSSIVRPKTSIARSSLFTGSSHEPEMFSELRSEIVSCNRLDMIVSFIKWSGLRLLIEELEQFTSRGGKLRIITTSYMGATDFKAIERLSKLQNTEIKISYDTKRTRLHAKAYVFYRDTGFSTAYVGSSNMSNAALSSGLEWNVKVTSKDLPETISKIDATFETYWNDNEFESYVEESSEKLKQALMAEKYISEEDSSITTFDINPYSYQQEILDSLDAERKVRGHYKNLVIAATGTGKTMISAFDYKRFVKEQGKKVRLLFVAHREEILKQSIDTFRHVLKDGNFGDMFVGDHVPEQIDHLFISIQTFNSQKFQEKTTADFYDYIIVDEFHHAAAGSYQILLNHYKPKILLGLTATPERMDGKNILDYFDDRIASEIRLPEAIERKLLCPFQYFGVTDDIDLSTVKWSKGGYDKRELSNVYSLKGFAADKRASNIAESTIKYVSSINEVKGLGFCVSKEHAKFMSDKFNEFGISSMYLTSESSKEDRNSAKNNLVNGNIKFIFVVDLYNEGVDIPEINTVLFLRPTESLTVFLQQLGRGLRLSENKECLTVLDFIGQANIKYNFEDKFASLLIDNNRSLEKKIKSDFVSLPKGCYVKLEKKAKDYILSNIRASFGTDKGIISRIRTFKEDSGLELNLKNFLEYYHLDIRQLYRRGSFYKLCVLAGIKEDFKEPLEVEIYKSLPKFISVNSRRFIEFMLKVLENDIDTFNETEERMLQMMHFTVFQNSIKECGFSSLKESLNKIKENKEMCKELIEILEYNYEKIDFIDEEVDVGVICPLDLHCNYTRDQILVALDYQKPRSVMEGVKYFKEEKIDIFFVTLNKNEKDYSPTTMYEDYSINDTLFHWQSQSRTSENSETGKRYINQKSTENKILLFVREFKDDPISKARAPYTFLGKANYVEHTGSAPMSIKWKLDRPIPAKFLKKTAKMVIS